MRGASIIRALQRTACAVAPLGPASRTRLMPRALHLQLELEALHARRSAVVQYSGVLQRRALRRGVGVARRCASSCLLQEARHACH